MEEPLAVSASSASIANTFLTADTHSPEFFAQLLAEQGSLLRSLTHGDTLDGVIMSRSGDEILIDIGHKSEGVVSNREMQSLTPAERDALTVGQTLLTFVVQAEDEQGRVVLSLDRARQELSWRNLQQLADTGTPIEAVVVNYNKGGLLVNLDGVRGFIPTSQISGIGRGTDSQKQIEMARMIGSTLLLKVVEMSRQRNRLILSERQANMASRDQRKDVLLSEIKVNDIREGAITSVCDFGVFVDVGGADGLVHLSELSWSRVRHPNDLYKVGDRVTVMVLSIDVDHRRIALSIKRTLTEPWGGVEAQFAVDQVITGVVTQIAPFGTFVRLAEGIEGLIHVSELNSKQNASRPVLTSGEEVAVRVVRIDVARRRIGLSLQTTPDGDPSVAS
jgi:small subunit ribosomal protein S1